MKTKTIGRCRARDIGLVARATVAAVVMTLAASILLIAGVVAVGSVILP